MSDDDTQSNRRGKRADLEADSESGEGEDLTTAHGVPVSDTDNSLKAGSRGPTIMEDVHFREKMTQFDHESIPERVVHARGTGAHGHFEAYEDPDLRTVDGIEDLTKAGFLTDPDRETPVFVRFSTVVGSRGSADTVRDVRGFATKFYTEEGTFDLVGNNIPIFFIQDAIEFPDLVHAIKPEPDDGIPQASAAHDTFWDFASLKPEITHMLLWILSDRAIPRAYRMMQGFGVHTFRLVNDEGDSRFVKFHWHPEYGTHGLDWDETQKIAGTNPDFNRQGLYDCLEAGMDPSWELGLQIFTEAEAEDFDFDVLDPTKIVPESEIPVQPVGRMTLTDPPDNFFAETEQVAFHPGNVVPGIDFSNDPLLQGRLFSYQDTQINRFGSANWDELPINRPLADRHTNQRAGFMRSTINTGEASYKPNSIEDDDPAEVAPDAGGFEHFAERVAGEKIRERSDSFEDHFSQARLFWNSMSTAEKEHIVDAAHFELGKVDRVEIRERVVHDLFNNVDHTFAVRVAEGIGIDPPDRPGDDIADHDRSDAALSMENTVTDTIETRRVAVLLDAGVTDEQVSSVRATLESAGARVHLVSRLLGDLEAADGGTFTVDKSHVTTGSVLYDAVYVPGGRESVNALVNQGDALHFLAEAFKHKKPIGAVGEGVDLLEAAELPLETAPAGSVAAETGVVTSDGSDMDAFLEAFAGAIASHRHWNRPDMSIPA